MPSWIEGDGVHGDLVAEVRGQQVAGLGVPQFHGAVESAGGQLRAVGRIGDAPNIAAVPFPGFDELARCRHPRFAPSCPSRPRPTAARRGLNDKP